MACNLPPNAFYQKIVGFLTFLRYFSMKGRDGSLPFAGGFAKGG
jgi:hypothetical protein